MKKIKTNSKAVHGPRPVQQPVRKESNQSSSGGIPPIVVNLIAGVVLIVLISFVKNNNTGYKWMWETLIKANIESMRENEAVTDYDKNLSRHGKLFAFLSLINKQTPENAVILMPRDSVINRLDPNLKLTELKNRTIVTFFIYPRKAVYPDSELDKQALSKANYIAIVNYSGYEQLKHAPKTRQPFSVEPL